MLYNVIPDSCPKDREGFNDEFVEVDHRHPHDLTQACIFQINDGSATEVHEWGCMVLFTSMDPISVAKNEHKELAILMKSGKTPKKDFLVVDVRDDDYAGGNIKDSLNVPSRGFLMNVDDLVKQTKKVPIVIFHCALSQVR
jgi:hypothetical protein